MHWKGHLGAALLAYTPVGVTIALLSTVEWAALGAVIAASLATLPDVDHHIQRVDHRGITHTVYFAVLVGLVVGLGGAVVGLSGVGPSILALTGSQAVRLGVLGFVVGTVTICSHIAADAITPMGVDPFRRGKHASFDLTKARNPTANYLLLALGLGSLTAGLVFLTLV